MTIETTRPLMRLGIRAEPELERAVEDYIARAGEQPLEGDGLTHWKCPDLCGASCRCTGLARRLAHTPWLVARTAKVLAGQEIERRKGQHPDEVRAE